MLATPMFVDLTSFAVVISAHSTALILNRHFVDGYLDAKKKQF